MGVALYIYNDEFINNKNEDYWYIAGFFAADGYVKDNLMELCLNEKDIAIIEKIRDIICPNKKIYIKAKTNARMLKIERRVIAQDFKKLFSLKTSKKHEELVFPEVPEKYLKDFVRGYVDGDGSIGTTKAYQTVNGEKRTYHGVRLRVLGNERFLRDMLDNIRQQVPNKTYCVRKKGAENVYEITYNFSVAERVINWMYESSSELFLERKKSKYNEILQNLKI